MVTIIVAITADKGAIGRGGDMIYHLRDDLRRFKTLTTGHTVVMGRRTFESLPKDPWNLLLTMMNLLQVIQWNKVNKQ